MSDISLLGLSPNLVLDAIENVDVEVYSGSHALNSYENWGYQFLAENGKCYVAKF
jgi:Ser/Thr protein kinase RdoA (MazF antagonist)